MPPKKTDIVNEKPAKKEPAAKKPAVKGAWMAHVKKTFEAEKKKDSSFTYKQAMSKAKTTYKK
tara:strand:- start:1546 stop:1734 length:189 start_codon:yes stop_codon:yes gene_type:complete